MDCTVFSPTHGIEPPSFSPVAFLPTRLSWSQMVAIEPRLAIIEADARRLRRSSDRSRAYESIKRRLLALVGWGATDARLATGDAYETAIAAVLSALETGGRR